jgi:polar amino acid transport system substrate-binding protein
LRLFTLLFSIIWCINGYAERVQTKIQIVTEPLPPFQMVDENGKVTGAMTDVLAAMFNEANLSYEIKVYPWARAYQLAKTTPNTLIYSMLRDENRETDFQWLGKIYAIKTYFATLNRRDDVKATSLAQAREYSVGSVRDDLAENYLKQHGFVEGKNLYLNSNYITLWEMMFNGRTDMVVTNSVVWPFEVKDSGKDPDEVKLLFEIDDISTDLYVAANKNSDRKIIDQLQLALVTIKLNGIYQKILEKWQLPLAKDNK